MRVGKCQPLIFSNLVGLLAMAGCGGSDSAQPEISRNDTTLVSRTPDTEDTPVTPDLQGLNSDELPTSSPAAVEGKTEKPKLVVEQEKIERFADGQIRRRFDARIYDNNEIVFHGRYVEYYPNGKRFKQGMYVEGKQDGVWGYWHDNGRIAKKGKFILGEHDGVWIYKTNRGYLRRQESYKNGLKDGLWIVYGRKPGTKVREENWKDGKRHGKTIEFFPETGENQVVTEWANGQKDGREMAWYPDGSKAVERHYKNGELHGRAVAYAPSGAVRTEVEYVNGVRTSAP